MIEKQSIQYSISMKGGVTEKDGKATSNIEIDLDGENIYLKALIIQAMKSSEEVAKLILDAADYYKEAEKFEYNKN